MTANEIRQSFLGFFREKEHSIVPSASLMPTSPNLTFTNAGMNQFVPWFLGTENAPYDPPRAADTQKCIRAGGKHNDLEDVGYDTYHHTFFEMLGNWSFGDYFKKEAIEWAWELVVTRWGFPPERLYATVYAPAEGDPSEFDQEAWDYWARLFTAAGLDPKKQIVNGNVKDNFWAMGDTGPCGPCSELHVDLTPKGDTEGSLVNMDDPRCIEIWNLVFIQYNRDEDGSYRPLPSQHVDTGMGFERACSIIQNTKGFSDFSKAPSNYDTDVFTPLFAKIAEISGKTYTATVPEKREGLTEQENVDVAFRVIADHVRTLSFSIADGIIPSNNGRNYVLRRILRRAVRFARELGLEGGQAVLPQLAPVLIEQFGEAFPELKAQEARILETLESEEVLFNRTLDRGLRYFDEAAEKAGSGQFPPQTVVKLWETFGFPLDLTELMLRERGLETDTEEVEALVVKHKETGAEGGGGTVVSAVTIKTDAESEFVGFETDATEAQLLEVVEEEGQFVAIVDRSPLYVEKGGQLGDTGILTVNGTEIEITATSSVGDALCLHLSAAPPRSEGSVQIQLNETRRRDIEKHHTATHIMHWALHEKVDPEAAQQGSLVAPDRLRFDFNSKALEAEQIASVEALVNEKIAEDAPVSWQEVPHTDIKDRDDIMQFFGDKYGDLVRVVQIGGEPQSLSGYSMELCGGTHVRHTGEIDLFAIKSEGAVAAGIRRVEALCGNHARDYLQETIDGLKAEIDTFVSDADKLSAELGEKESHALSLDLPDPATVQAGEMAALGTAIRDLKETRDRLKERVMELRKKQSKQAGKVRAAAADKLLGALVAESMASEAELPAIVRNLEGADGALLQEAMNSLRKHQFGGAAVLTAVEGDKVHIGIFVAREQTSKVKAGDLMKELAPIAGGRGGGKPEMARGAGNDPSKLEDLLIAAREKLGA